MQSQNINSISHDLPRATVAVFRTLTGYDYLPAVAKQNRGSPVARVPAVLIREDGR